MIKGIVALLIIFSCIYTAGATEILVADWTTYESHISITNASTNTITFVLNDAVIGANYHFRYANGTSIVNNTATSTTLSLTASGLPDGGYLITRTHDNPSILISTYNDTIKTLAVTNVSTNDVIFNISNATNDYRYTLRDINSSYITSGYSVDNNVYFNVYGLLNGTYYIYMETPGATTLIDRNYILTKQMNISYVPKYVGEQVSLVYNVNESYVFINLKSTSSSAIATNNGTHLIITDVVTDLHNNTYYNLTATRKSTITRDATFTIATIVIGGLLVREFRKRRWLIW